MKVIARVYVQSKDGIKSSWLKPGDAVPDWAEVTNPAAVEAGAHILPVPAPGESDGTSDGKDETAEVVEAPVEEAPKPRRRTSSK